MAPLMAPQGNYVSNAKQAGGIASGNDPAFRLRLPKRLKKEMTAVAQANGRSLNSEIVQRLQESLNDSAAVSSPTSGRG